VTTFFLILTSTEFEMIRSERSASASSEFARPAKSWNLVTVSDYSAKLNSEDSPFEVKNLSAVLSNSLFLDYLSAHRVGDFSKPAPPNSSPPATDGAYYCSRETDSTLPLAALTFSRGVGSATSLTTGSRLVRHLQ